MLWLSTCLIMLVQTCQPRRIYRYQFPALGWVVSPSMLAYISLEEGPYTIAVAYDSDLLMMLVGDKDTYHTVFNDAALIRVDQLDARNLGENLDGYATVGYVGFLLDGTYGQDIVDLAKLSTRNILSQSGRFYCGLD